MKAKSYCSVNTQPYRAGLEIGEQIAEINPEIIFLFASIHYEGSPELVEGIYDSLEPGNPVIIGNTCDGFYERERVDEAGVSVLAINSEGRVRWHLAHETDAGKSPREAAWRCMKRLKDACGEATPSFYYLSCDYRMDTTELIQAIHEMTDLPVIGGSAADDFQFSRTFVYVNRKVLENSIAMLAVEGNLRFDIFVSNDMLPVGNPGTITDCHDTFINTINGRSASQFIRQETGAAVNVSNQGTLSMRLTDKSHQEKRLRSLLVSQEEQDSDKIQVFGGVHKGDTAQLCYMSAKNIIEDINKVATEVAALPYTPQMALLISCAGRKRVLGDQIDQEVAAIKRNCPDIPAISGFSSFGEFSPLRTPDGYTRSLFHNMTCVLLVLSEDNAT